MFKIIARVFPKLGKLPAWARDTLAAEDVRFLEEQVTGTITFRNYRAPGRYSSWKRQWFLGSLALTSHQVIGYGWQQKLVDFSYDHPDFKQIHITQENPDRLCIAFDVAPFFSARSGTIEVRYDTPQAGAIIAFLQQYTA